MRLLWISPETPDVLGGGGQRRQFHQIKVLGARGVDVHVATLAGKQDDSSLRALVPVTRFRARRLRGHLTTFALDRIVDLLRPDAAVLAHVEAVQLAKRKLSGRDIPVLIDFHNVYSRYYADTGRVAEAQRWRFHERDALTIATVATACSGEEIASLRAINPAAQVELAPHGVDRAEWPDRALSAERTPTLAFVGSLTHPPNVEGLRWLSERVWPEIVATIPSARLLVFGPGECPIQPYRGIEIRGRVDDLAQALGAVSVAVVPIVHGVGSRVKFIECLASGAAVVSTSLGAEGFDVGETFLRADDPQSFAAACTSLLRDPQRAAALGAAGRAAALSDLTWQKTGAPLLRFAGAL